MVLMAHGRPPLDRLLGVGAKLTSQQVAISLHNDWCDRELDCKAKPWRAIPSGLIAPTSVRSGAWALAALSLIVSLGANWLELILDAVGLAAGFAYNARLKRTALSWLPFAVAFPLLPLFGAASIDGFDRVFRLALPCFAAGAPLGVAIHLADTLPDLRQDRAHGLRGVGYWLGVRGSRVACAVLFAGGLLLLAANVRQIVG